MMINILIGIAIFFAIIFIVALFVRKEYIIQRDVTVNKSKEEVFSYIKYLKNQELYSKWVMKDPSMQKTFKGTDGTVGFKYAWDSTDKQVGKGEQEIKTITEAAEITTEVRFTKPFENTAATFMKTETLAANTTRLTWGMTGKNPYPMNLMNLFIPGMLGKDMAESLGTLKANLEK